MSLAVPAEIAALQKRYKERGSLNATEIQTLLDWQIRTTEAEQKRAKSDGDPETVEKDDIVEFTMPRTTQGGTYKLNRAWFGVCRAPYHVFIELARMYEQDRLGLRELFEKRGEALLGTGLKDHIDFTVPPLRFRIVQRAAKKGTNAQAA